MVHQAKMTVYISYIDEIGSSVNRNDLNGKVYNYVITEYNEVKKVKNVK